MLTCRELVGELRRYLDGEQRARERVLFRAHLARCGACASYVATYRDSVTLARAVNRDAEERTVLPERLVRSVMAALSESRAHLWNLLAAVAASPLLFFYFGSK